MRQHPLPALQRSVSAIGLGAWQLGAAWAHVDDDVAGEILAASVAHGVSFVDTADKYGDGASERAIGRFLAAHPSASVTVATKMGRRLPQVRESYTLDNFRAWTERSRRNLGVDVLDLVQLHCPPSAVIDDAATYAALDQLVSEGGVRACGVSVETCAQALVAIDAGVASIQIVFNPFRLRPLDDVLPAARAAGIAVFARVPLASGLLTGRFDRNATFPGDDPRTYNARGEAFDRGETFAGVDLADGVDAAADLAARLPADVDLAAATLAWIASRPGVTSVIPGARSAAQATQNAAAARLLDGGFDLDLFDAHIHEVYDRRLRAAVHHRW